MADSRPSSVHVDSGGGRTITEVGKDVVALEDPTSSGVIVAKQTYESTHYLIRWADGEEDWFESSQLLIEDPQLV